MALYLKQFLRSPGSVEILSNTLLLQLLGPISQNPGLGKKCKTVESNLMDI